MNQQRNHLCNVPADDRLSPLRFFLMMLALFGFTASAPSLAGEDDRYADANACVETTKLVNRACRRDVLDNFLMARAICINLKDDYARYVCIHAARQAQREEKQLCGEQRAARRELCQRLGPDPYDVTDLWVATNFVDPLSIGVATPPNSYFPLVPGVRVFEGSGETVTVTVTGRTKLINGVTCVVVRDLVSEDGIAVEDTDDWYAQDLEGNVWYCGEVSQNFELFEGDAPVVAELVDIEGSWKAFRDGAMPGILMKAYPQAGDVYRQEMALGDAEDAAEVVTTQADGMLPGDECTEHGTVIASFVAQACQADCLVTREFTPIDPEVSEHKYYATNLGLILEVDPEGSCIVPEGVVSE